MKSKTVVTAKVFASGLSQAVRLPKAYRFTTKEVLIEKVGIAVILRPKLDKKSWWTEMESILSSFEGMELVERARLQIMDPSVSLD